MSYSQAYNNSQTHSPLFCRYLTEVSDSLVERYHLTDKAIIEVGCGKGDFLRLLCRGGRNRGLGFDPSYIGPETDEQGAVHFVTEFYEGQRSDPPPDFVCCRHVIEHIPAPLEMLHGIRNALGESSVAVVYFETPNVEWVFEQTAFWDFFYEHCSYFTPDTLTWAVEMSGFSVLNVKSIFGGQYLSIEAKPRASQSALASPPPNEVGRLEKQVRAFSDRVARKVNDCREQVLKFSRHGGCALWGAAAKGVTFANIIDPCVTDIKCIVDINPAKAGRYVPGTGHPIVSLEALGNHYSVAGLLSMNSNYLLEQRAMLSGLSLAIPVEALR
ncbi:MAG TPA: class I SAM-dependent methyltransferase [Terriglobia bacterium]|nr:class I SAM-dependent methyltransferase [Terriglobia bacterium]